MKTAEAISLVRDGLPAIPGVDAVCHRGICDQGQCSNCQRIIAAHNALTELDPHALLGYPEASVVGIRRSPDYQISLYGCANSVLVASADCIADAKSRAVRMLLRAAQDILNLTGGDFT